MNNSAKKVLLSSLLPGKAFKWCSLRYTRPLILNWDCFPFSAGHSWFYGSRDHLTIFLALAVPQKLMLTLCLWPNGYEFFLSPPWSCTFLKQLTCKQNKCAVWWSENISFNLACCPLPSSPDLKSHHVLSPERGCQVFFQKETFCTDTFQVQKCRRWDINIWLQITPKLTCFSPSIWRVSLAWFPDILVECTLSYCNVLAEAWPENFWC